MIPRHPLAALNARLRHEIAQAHERLADEVDTLLAALPQDTYVTASMRRQLMDALAPHVDRLYGDGQLIAQKITEYSEEARQTIIAGVVEEWRDALGDDLANAIENIDGAS